jgi:hypothetical protein
MPNTMEQIISPEEIREMMERMTPFESVKYCPCHDDLPRVLRSHEAQAVRIAELEADIDKFWSMLHNAWDIEPREYFEKEARENGFDSPLAMAAHYMWKREPSVAALREQLKAKDAEIEQMRVPTRCTCNSPNFPKYHAVGLHKAKETKQ